MNHLSRFITPYKKAITASVLFMFLDVVCEVLQPALMANIVGKGIESQNVGYIVGTGLSMIAIALVAIFAGFGNVRNSAIAGVGFASKLRRGLFAKVQEFSFYNIDSFSTASLSTRLTNDVTLLQNSAIMCLRLALRAPMMFVFALIMAIHMNAKLAIILVVVIPALALILFFIIRKAMPRFGKMQAKMDGLNSSVQENLRNVRVIKSFVRQDYEKEKFQTANDDLMQASLKAMNTVIITMPLMMLAMNLSSVAVVWFGGGQVINGQLNVAEMTAFINYILQILMSLMMVSMMFVLFSRASASYKRIVEVLDAEVDLKDSNDAIQHTVKGTVTFDNVSFQYGYEESEPVLKDINFTANAGEVIAIVGPTGAGKSSLVQLIPRLYDVKQGKVMIDGKDVRDYSVESLRSQVGMVLQKNTLFSGTVRENIKWGNENASEERIIQASKDAQAHEFISSFPNGYDTWIEQGGVNVSGGQKQRLCIARAILKQPRILILDDSTSAVDTATESKIRTIFKTSLKHTTTFLIAQRISSVKDADRILVLNDGKISAAGTHDELLKTSKEYQEIYQSQIGKEAE